MKNNYPGSLQSDDQEITRLNYQMIFDDEHPEKKEKNSNKKTLSPEAKLKEKEVYWEKKHGQIEKSAYQKGFQEGLKKGRAEAAAEIDQKLAAIEGALQQAHNEWTQLQRELTPGLLNLIFDITEKILGVPVPGSRIEKPLEDALSAFMQSADQISRPILKISPEDMDLVRSILKRYADGLTVQLQEDKHLKPGEFVFETDRKKVVRTYKMMLDDLKKNLSLPDW